MEQGRFDAFDWLLLSSCDFSCLSSIYLYSINKTLDSEDFKKKKPFMSGNQ